MNGLVSGLVGGLVITVGVILHDKGILGRGHLVWLTALLGTPLVLYNLALWGF